jgi:hypothetical protein
MDPYAHLKFRANSSCHFCKHKRDEVLPAPCGKNSHKFCRLCTKKHNLVDFDQARAAFLYGEDDYDILWDECPVCLGNCSCSHCKKAISRHQANIIVPSRPKNIDNGKSRETECNRKSREAENQMGTYIPLGLEKAFALEEEWDGWPKSYKTTGSFVRDDEEGVILLLSLKKRL